MNKIQLNEFVRKLRPIEIALREKHPNAVGTYTGLDGEYVIHLRQDNLLMIGSAGEGTPLHIVGDPQEQQRHRFAIYQHDRFGLTGYHSHDFIELAFLYAGSCETEIEGRTFQLKAGDVCLMNTETLHRIGPTGENDILINFLFPADFFDLQFLETLEKNPLFSDFFLRSVYRKDNGKHFLLFHPQDGADLREVLERIMCEYFDADECSRPLLNNLLPILFYELLRIARREPEHVIAEAKTSDSQVVQMLEYLERHFVDASLESVAAKFGYSPGYVSSLLRRTTGKGFSQLRQELRLRYAAFALRSTNDSIQSIAASAGYQNLTHFYTLFRSQFGVTPSEYRGGQI